MYGPCLSARRSAGFTIVEMLVGIAIALIGIVVMFQVQSNWERQRSGIASGGDAQVAGSISAFQLQRDLRNAGSGFANSGYLNCTVAANDGGRAFNFSFVPVLITDGAGGAPDSITVLWGNSDTPTPTYQVAGATTDRTDLKDVRAGLALGDLVVVSTPGSPAACRLLEITSLTPPAPDNGRAILHAAGSYTRPTAPPENRKSGTGACSGSGTNWTCSARYQPVTLLATYTSAPPSYGELRSLGDDPRLNVWAVDSVRRDVLTRVDALHGTAAVDIGDGIIDLQAQYGLDTDNDDVVDTWQATAPADWTQLRTLRFAILSRGQQYERTAVTLNAPVWSGGAFVMRNVDGTADSGASALGVNNWRNYQYAVFEQTVPLKNVIWRKFW